MKLSWLPLCLTVVLGTPALPGLAQEDPSEPSGVEERAAVLKVSQGVLYTLPEEQDGALQALRARPAGEGLWTAMVRDVTGKLGSVRFVVATIDDLGPYWPPDTSPGDPVPCPNPDIEIYRNSICDWPWIAIGGFGCVNNGSGSYNTTYIPFKVCRKKAGGGYCVNERAATSYTYWYNQADCAGGISNVTTTYGMLCGY